MRSLNLRRGAIAGFVLAVMAAAVSYTGSDGSVLSALYIAAVGITGMAFVVGIAMLINRSPKNS